MVRAIPGSATSVSVGRTTPHGKLRRVTAEALLRRWCRPTPAHAVDFYTMKVTVPEAARRAGRSPETVRRWIWSGRLPSQKVGNQHLVDTDALDLMAGVVEPGRGPLATVGEEWGSWLTRADSLRARLRAAGRRLPPAGDLVAESRRGR